MLIHLPFSARNLAGILLRGVRIFMKLFTTGVGLALLSFCILGLSGCQEDNEAAINEQAALAKAKIPGSRTAQALTQEEYYEITPGVRGAGMRVGPRPDQGAGYPGQKK